MSAPGPTEQGVSGYRQLSAEELALINATKDRQREVADWWAKVATTPGVDPRSVAIARTHFEEGFSALVKSIARPDDPFGTALTAAKDQA